MLSSSHANVQSPFIKYLCDNVKIHTCTNTHKCVVSTSRHYRNVSDQVMSLYEQLELTVQRN